MHYVLSYDLSPDYLARRGAHRQEHLALAWAAVERGELLLGGPMHDLSDGAMLLFKADSPAVPESFARHDPYVKHGLVTGWRVAHWNTVVGTDAITPTRLP